MGTTPTSFDLLPAAAKRRQIEFLMHADAEQRAHQKICAVTPTAAARQSYAEARRLLREAEDLHRQVRAGRAPDALRRLQALMLKSDREDPS